MKVPHFKLFLILILISLFIMLFDNFKLLNLPKSVIQYLTIPIQYGLYQSGISITKQFEFLILARYSALENKALKIQLGELITQNSNLKKQLQETQDSIDQYNKLSPQTFDLLPARILGISRYLLVDKGSLDGVSIGQVVVFKDNFIGVVKNVSPKTSQILLSTDPDSKIAIFSQGNEKARGIIQGQFGSELLMDKILHQEKIEVGDLVYSEGTEGKLPKGLILGKVIEVLERQNEIFQQAKVKPIFNLDDLGVVFMIRT